MAITRVKLQTCPCGQVINTLGRHVQQRVTRSVAGVRLGPVASVYQRIISNDSYAHDEQGDNPGQVRGFDGVLYKLWPLLMPLRAHPLSGALSQQELLDSIKSAYDWLDQYANSPGLTEPTFTQNSLFLL